MERINIRSLLTVITLKDSESTLPRQKKKMNEDKQIKKIVKQLRKSVKSHAKQADTLEKKITEGSLHKWFKGSKSKDGKGGWVNVVTGGTCASDEPAKEHLNVFPLQREQA